MIPYGKWHFVVVRWISINSYTHSSFTFRLGRQVSHRSVLRLVGLALGLRMKAPQARVYRVDMGRVSPSPLAGIRERRLPGSFFLIFGSRNAYFGAFSSLLMNIQYTKNFKYNNFSNNYSYSRGLSERGPEAAALSAPCLIRP